MGSHSKLEVGDGEDKISQLPDALLSHILSFLTTKQAVRTSILSTRWNNIWVSVPSLDLVHYYCNESRSLHAAFVSFVDRALHCRGLLDIQRFHLRYYCFAVDLSRIDGWIRNVICRNVVELDLYVRVYEDTVEKIELPKTIFLCKTLVVLKLNFNCFIYAPPESGSFPNLKRLTIDFASYMSLEEPYMSYEDPYEYYFYFSINAPKLEFLNLKVDFLPSIVFEDAKSLVKAVLSFSHHDAIEHEHYDDRATTLLAAISNVQHLTLSVHSLAASFMPAFDNLIHLKLVINSHFWEVLPELLHRTPNLECLVLAHKKDVYCNSDCEVDSDSDTENSENEEYCDHQEYRVLSHLKTIVLRGFRGCMGEKEVAKYLLKIMKFCALFRKGSKTCRIQFI
ncbi:PREDICTED: F-box/LRR-repeat protein At4g14103-like [Fragaria vesca subsp. vesca]